MALLLVLMITITTIQITFSTEITTSVTPSISNDDNPYVVIATNSNNNGQESIPFWMINSQRPISLKLTNLTTFHPKFTSIINITMYSDQLFTDQELDIIISFIFNDKHFSIKINMNDQENNKISPECDSSPSLLSSSKNIVSIINNISSLSTSKWNDILSNNQLSESDLTPINLNTFNNSFPLQFSIESIPNENMTRFVYKSSQSVQSCSFLDSLSTNQAMHVMITTDQSSQILNISQFDIYHHVKDENDNDEIVYAEYSVILRNLNIYDLYPINTQSMILNKLKTTINAYFPSSSIQNHTNIIMIVDIEYDSDKSDTEIIFTLAKSDNTWSESQISDIYSSETDSQFYYLLTFHLNLTWQSDQENADFIRQQFEDNPLMIKFDYISIFLTDFPFVNSPTISVPNSNQNQPETTENIDTNKGAITSTIDRNILIDPNNNNIFAENNDSSSNPDLIMSWPAFAIIVTILLVCIIIMGILIVMVNKKTETLDAIAKARGSRQHLGTGSGKSQQGIASLPSSPSVEVMPIHAAQNPPIIGIAPNGDRRISNIASEGRQSAMKPPMIAVNNDNLGGGLKGIQENIAQPPSINLVNIHGVNNGLQMPSQNNLKMGKQASMEFNVHISDVVAADDIVMNDIIEDMEDDNIMPNEAETPAGFETPGGDDLYMYQGKDLNKLIEKEEIPDDTDEDQEDDIDDEPNINDDAQSAQYFGDLTPNGLYNEQHQNGHNKFGTE